MKRFIVGVFVGALVGVFALCSSVEAKWIDRGQMSPEGLRPFHLYQLENDRGDLVQTVIVFEYAHLGSIIGVHSYHVLSSGFDFRYTTVIRLVGIGPDGIEIITEKGDTPKEWATELAVPNQEPARILAAMISPLQNEKRSDRLVYRFAGSYGTLVPDWSAPIYLWITPFASSSQVWITPKLYE